MTEVRCCKCGKLLVKAEMFVGEIPCRGCKEVNQVNLVSQAVLTRYSGGGKMQAQLGASPQRATQSASRA